MEEADEEEQYSPPEHMQPFNTRVFVVEDAGLQRLMDHEKEMHDNLMSQLIMHERIS